MAGHKGYGLALLIETLSAVLTGAAVTRQVVSWTVGDPSASTGHGAAFVAVRHRRHDADRLVQAAGRRDGAGDPAVAPGRGIGPGLPARRDRVGAPAEGPRRWDHPAGRRPDLRGRAGAGAGPRDPRSIARPCSRNAPGDGRERADQRSRIAASVPRM